MDKELARFILRSYRPDDRDAGDARFAEALAHAASDPDLGAWFAAERAHDTAFAAAIAGIELPTHLRREILDALAYERGDLPHAESADDPEWARALASITPPPRLRDNIVAAMNASVARTSAARRWKRYAIPTAAAAAIALALALPATRGSGASSTGKGPVAGAATAATAEPLPIGMVRAGFLEIYQESGFTLDSGRASHREIMRRLEERGLPCPTCMPPGLRGIEGIGCRELVINGRRGTLVCYEKGEDGIIHLVIFRAEDIRCELPTRRGGAVFSQDGEWASACWRNRENAFVLIGHTDVAELASLF